MPAYNHIQYSYWGNYTMPPLTEKEVAINNAEVTVGDAADPVTPLGMNNKALGGSNSGNPSTGAGQYGAANGVGTNNVGLLVRVWGNMVSSGSDYVEISDGSGMNVRVDTTGLATQTTGYVTLTGISSLYGTTGNASRILLAID